MTEPQRVQDAFFHHTLVVEEEMEIFHPFTQVLTNVAGLPN